MAMASLVAEEAAAALVLGRGVSGKVGIAVCLAIMTAMAGFDLLVEVTGMS